MIASVKGAVVDVIPSKNRTIPLNSFGVTLPELPNVIAVCFTCFQVKLLNKSRTCYGSANPSKRVSLNSLMSKLNPSGCDTFPNLLNYFFSTKTNPSATTSLVLLMLTSFLDSISSNILLIAAFKPC